MKSAIASRFSRRKFLILIAALAVAAGSWFCAYNYFKAELSSYQLNRPIDIKNKSGLSRMKLYMDSTSVAGIAFCVTAIVLVIATKSKGHSK